jgi:DNA/RNA-binding domain of Phe-tRNA-synthetase-like protein
MGAYDVERLPAPSVVLRFPREGDVFHPLGGRPEDMPLKPTVVVYASGSEVLCWSFNHRDSAKTALHADTDVGMFMAEAVAHIQYESLDAAFAELARDLRDAGAEVGELTYVSASVPAATVRLG